MRGTRRTKSYSAASDPSSSPTMAALTVATTVLVASCCLSCPTADALRLDVASFRTPSFAPVTRTMGAGGQSDMSMGLRRRMGGRIRRGGTGIGLLSTRRSHTPSSSPSSFLASTTTSLRVGGRFARKSPFSSFRSPRVELRMANGDGDEAKEGEAKDAAAAAAAAGVNEKGASTAAEGKSGPIKKLLTKAELNFLKLYDAFLAALPPPVASFLAKTITRFLDFAPTLRTIGFSFLAGAVVAITAVVVPVFTSVDKMTEPVTLFETILSDLDRGYVDTVDTQKLFETGVSAMLRSLDPYTEFEGRQEAVEMQESVSGRYGGVGLVISGRESNKAAPATDAARGDVDDEDYNGVEDGDGDAVAPTADSPSSMMLNMNTDGAAGSTDAAQEKLKLRQKRDADAAALAAKKDDDKNRGIRVVSAFEGYAYDAGMRVGDRLVAVDDYKITPKTTVEDVRNRLRGDPGSGVTVHFERDGVEGVQAVDIPRQIVKIRDVKAATMLGNARDGIGYVQLSGFSQDAGSEMRSAITYLQRSAEMASDGTHSLKGLVVDLRQNPGGLLTSAVDVTSLLVPKNSDIVSARGRGFPNVLYRSRVDPLVDPSTKLVVLVSKNTASAAEIVSGAVQDLDVGVILGSERTYGKGLVQNVEELPFDTALKFTVAKYYTPSGRCIQSTNYKEGGGLDENKVGFEATKVEEKDKTEFFTARGRTVKDGGGIEADVKVAAPKASALEVSLLRENLLNEYAAEWSKGHELTNSFEVTDDMYDDFQRFVLRKQDKKEIDLIASIYSGTIDALKKTLKQSGYTHSLTKELESLQASIRSEMKSDFVKYKKDLKEDLGQAILARYLPESMLVARGVRDDVQVKAAVKLIGNDNKFNTILARSTDVGGKNKRELSIDEEDRRLASGGNRNRNQAKSMATDSFGAVARDRGNDDGARLGVKW